jgi:HPt (histidine-containing phosphotransfer) domain-containing protein
MSDYLSKPVQPDHLLGLVADCLEERRRHSAAKVADLDQALQRVQGRQEFLHRLADRFVQAVPCYLESLRRAVLQGNLPAVAATAHRFKGEACTFDAERVVACAEELESAAENGDAAAAQRVMPRLSDEAECLSRALRRRQ